MVGDIERAVGALNSAEVRYLVVGGVAVVLYGHLRTTADLGLVVQLERDNVLKALRALADLGYRPRVPVAAEAFADGHRRRQARIGLGLTPLQRLRWLQQTMDEMRRILGRARAVQRQRKE